MVVAIYYIPCFVILSFQGGTGGRFIGSVRLGLIYECIGFVDGIGHFYCGPVLLAESEFQHELEIAIEPFKRLLFSLFFFRWERHKILMCSLVMYF